MSLKNSLAQHLSKHFSASNAVISTPLYCLLATLFKTAIITKILYLMFLFRLAPTLLHVIFSLMAKIFQPRVYYCLVYLFINN